MTKICAPNSESAVKVKKAKQSLIEDKKAWKISEILKVLSDPTRIKIVSAIANDEICVCEIASTLQLSQSLVSHQLRALRHLGLVNLRKNGRNMYYSLNNAGVQRILEECKRMTQVRK